MLQHYIVRKKGRIKVERRVESRIYRSYYNINTVKSLSTIAQRDLRDNKRYSRRLKRGWRRVMADWDTGRTVIFVQRMECQFCPPFTRRIFSPETIYRRKIKSPPNKIGETFNLQFFFFSTIPISVLATPLYFQGGEIDSPEDIQANDRPLTIDVTPGGNTARYSD